MKTQKKLWFIAILVAVPFIVNAQQWGNNGTSIYNTNTGYVGIGRTDPSTMLDVTGTGTWGISRFTSPVDVTMGCHLELFEPQGTGGIRPISLRFHQANLTWGRLEYNGNFHFKTGDPASQAYVNVYTGNLYINKPNAQLNLVSTDANRAQMHIYTQGDGANDLFLGANGLMERYSISGRNAAEGYDLKIYRNNGGWSEMMVFDWVTGNVGIGTTAPANKLSIIASGSSTSPPQVQIGPVAGNGLFLKGSSSSTHYNWLIAEQDQVNAALEFSPSTTVGGTTWATPLMVIKQSGNIGIGTTVPGAKLEVEIGAGTAEFDKGIVIHSGNGTYTSGHGNMLQFENEDVVVAGIRGDREGGWAGDLQFFTHLNSAGNTYGTTFTEKMRITAAGNVGIGTLTPSQKLTVNGKILAEEVEVVADVPDYVFKEDYKLMSLAELDKFIKANKHLPEVPSEKEVCDNGSKIGLGEMNHILLKKIEELTLYTLQQNEQIKQLQDQINAIH